MPKKILITGGLGYLGVRLSNYLANNPESLSWNGKKKPIREIVLLGRRYDTPNKHLLIHKPKILLSDLSSSKDVELIAKGDYDSIFHFGSAVSAACQRNPELGEKNVEATKIVLEGASKDIRKRKLVVFPSSYLVFENMSEAKDDTAPNSTTSYGRSKWKSEYLGMNYVDRVNFRGVRLPTVIAAREPTSAATAYAYNLPNKILRGEDCTIPVPKEYRMPLIWIDDAIQAFIKIHNLDEESLMHKNRPYHVINLSGHSPTAEEWVNEIERIGRRYNRKLGNIIWRKDTATMEVIGSAISYIKGMVAERLGILSKTSITDMIEKITHASVRN